MRERALTMKPEAPPMATVGTTANQFGSASTLASMRDQVIRLRAEDFEDLPPRTADDVTITKDGRRLDTKDKVLVWLAELEQQRAPG
jgi:hypothetical protein